MALRTLKAIKELRFILCQSSPASENLRYDPPHIANTWHRTTRPFGRATLASQSASAKEAPPQQSLLSPTVWRNLSI
jgi:hypothetical protein